MKCFRCGKETEREDGDYIIQEIRVEVTLEEPNRTPEIIACNNCFDYFIGVCC